MVKGGGEMVGTVVCETAGRTEMAFFFKPWNC